MKLLGVLGVSLALLPAPGCGGDEAGEVAVEATTQDPGRRAPKPAKTDGDPPEQPGGEQPDGEQPDGEQSGGEQPEGDGGPEFIRFVETGEHQGRLETAVATYRNGDGVEVDFVAVVHIADTDYYEALDELFEGYDAVLYEMVQPEGADPSRAGKSGSPVSFIQKGMCRALGLAFQLDAVDYAAENFVHADLTTEGFARVWEEKNMNFFKLAGEIILSSLGSQGASKLTPQAMFEAVRSKDRKQRMKFLLGQEFSNIEKMFSGGGPGGENESMLIGERNKAALAVLAQQIEDGKRRLCLFYGAGHMVDFELRLQRDHAFEKVGVEWLTAWNVGPR